MKDKIFRGKVSIMNNNNGKITNIEKEFDNQTEFDSFILEKNNELLENVNSNLEKSFGSDLFDVLPIIQKHLGPDGTVMNKINPYIRAINSVNNKNIDKDNNNGIIEKYGLDKYEKSIQEDDEFHLMINKKKEEILELSKVIQKLNGYRKVFEANKNEKSIKEVDEDIAKYLEQKTNLINEVNKLMNQ